MPESHIRLLPTIRDIECSACNNSVQLRRLTRNFHTCPSCSHCRVTRHYHSGLAPRSDASSFTLSLFLTHRANLNGTRAGDLSYALFIEQRYERHSRGPTHDQDHRHKALVDARHLSRGIENEGENKIEIDSPAPLTSLPHHHHAPAYYCFHPASRIQYCGGARLRRCFESEADHPEVHRR